MKKVLLTFGLAVFAASVVSAQPKNNFHNHQVGTYERVTKHGPYLTGRLFDNTFLSVGGGVNIYGYKYSGSKKPKLSKRMAPSVDVYFGKWVTPTLGLRVGYNGMKTKGLYGLRPGGKDVLEKLSYMYVHGDMLINLNNALGGYRENRFWNLVPFVGAGYARAWNSSKYVNSHKLAATTGLLNNLRLGHRVDLTLEARWMFVDRRFDNVAGKNKVDKIFSATAGLSFKFGPRGGFKRPVYQAPVDVTGYQNRIKALEGDVARDRATIDRLNRELSAAQNRPAPTAPVEKVAIPVAITTQFMLGKADVRENQMANLKSIAEVIKANPARKFHVTGYADAGTGSKALNQKLSEQRAHNVADVLVKRFGVNRSQLVISGKGGVAKHPSTPVLDRVVVSE